MNPEKLKALLALLRRHLFSVICSAVALVALVMSGLWWLGIEDLRNEHEQKSNQNDKRIILIKTGPVLKTELAAIKDFTQRLESNLTVEDNLSDNDDYFRKIAQFANVRLADFQQMNSLPLEEGDLFKRIPFTIHVTGTYARVAYFLHAVETGARLANVTSLAMVRFPPTSADVSLDLTLELIGQK